MPERQRASCSAFFVTRAFLEDMIAKKAGAILRCTSPRPGWSESSTYAAPSRTPVDEISAALQSRIQEWIAGSEQHDDLTFLLESIS